MVEPCTTEWVWLGGNNRLYTLYSLPVHTACTLPGEGGREGGTTTLCFASTVSNIGLPSLSLSDWTCLASRQKIKLWVMRGLDGGWLGWAGQSKISDSPLISQIWTEKMMARQHGVWRIAREIFSHSRTFPRFLIRTIASVASVARPLRVVCWVLILSLPAIKSVHGVSFRHLGPGPTHRHHHHNILFLRLAWTYMTTGESWIHQDISVLSRSRRTALRSPR